MAITAVQVKTLRELKSALHPQNFTNMSPKMAFIIGAILGEDWAKGPQGESSIGSTFSITSDGYVLSGNMFIGNKDEFLDNIRRLLLVAELPKAQYALFCYLMNCCITRF